MSRLDKHFDFPNSTNIYSAIYVKFFMSRLAKHFDFPTNTNIYFYQILYIIFIISHAQNY